MSSALLSAGGRELLDRLAGRDVGEADVLRLSDELRREFPPDLVAAALTQQRLRVAARSKFSRAGQMLFSRAGLEQASSELTAAHAARRFAGADRVADLCCGIGGNLIALASAASMIAEPNPHPAQTGFRDQDSGGRRDDGGQRNGGGQRDDRGQRRVVGVDLDAQSLEFARHNVAVCAPGARAWLVLADVTEFPLAGFDAVFIDPARRDSHGRLRAGAYRPPLAWCLALADVVPRTGIKAAPGLRRDLVPPGWETEFVAVGRELKEALLWSPALASGVASRATVLTARPGGPAGHGGPAAPGSTPTAAGAPSGAITHTLTAPEDDRAGSPPVRAPGEYLIDPNPAVTRAGLVAELAERTGTWQIDPMIAFLSGGEAVTTPFGRTLRVVESAPWHEKRFARRLRELGIGAADIRRRGLAGDVAQIHRRLGLRGPGAATVVLTRVNDRPWGLICQPVPAAASDEPSAGD